jgi:hypothetical protein
MQRASGLSRYKAAIEIAYGSTHKMVFHERVGSPIRMLGGPK